MSSDSRNPVVIFTGLSVLVRILGMFIIAGGFGFTGSVTRRAVYRQNISNQQTNNMRNLFIAQHADVQYTGSQMEFDREKYNCYRAKLIRVGVICAHSFIPRQQH